MVTWSDIRSSLWCVFARQFPVFNRKEQLFLFLLVENMKLFKSYRYSFSTQFIICISFVSIVATYKPFIWYWWHNTHDTHIFCIHFLMINPHRLSLNFSVNGWFTETRTLIYKSWSTCPTEWKSIEHFLPTTKICCWNSNEIVLPHFPQNNNDEN